MYDDGWDSTMTKNKKVSVFIFFLVLAMVFAGCVEESLEDGEQLSSELRILNWEDYLYPTIVEDFQSRYNVTLIIFTFDEEAYMISELETNPGGYDIVIASDTVVREMIAAKALAQINTDSLQNLDNIDTVFLDKSFDPGNHYSIPYLWGTTGIAYNTSALSNDIDSWDALFNTSYSGRIALLDNPMEVIGSSLKYLGYGINPTSVSELYEAEEILHVQKDIISGYFGSREIVDGLINGSFHIAQCYSGDALFAAERNEDITYIIPEEGSSIWIDNMVIPVDSPNKYTAEIFIDFILDPLVSSAITNYQWYANPNHAAIPYIDEEILEEAGIYPPDDVLKNCEFFSSLDSVLIREMNRIWSDLKS